MISSGEPVAVVFTKFDFGISPYPMVDAYESLYDRLMSATG